jgi:hypothetical protein
VVRIDRTKQQIAKHRWIGITLFNNFEFLKSGNKVRKVYKIGKGKLIKKADIKQMACTQGATGLSIDILQQSPALEGIVSCQSGRLDANREIFNRV